jgi:hypothetical protein
MTPGVTSSRFSLLVATCGALAVASLATSDCSRARAQELSLPQMADNPRQWVMPDGNYAS